MNQETVSGSGISWATSKSAPGSRQITTPVPHHSVFYRPDALPATQPTASKHWRHKEQKMSNSRNHSRGETFSLLLLFTEWCTTVVHKLCTTYAKYDRCHTISYMQFIIHLALEKKTIGVIFSIFLSSAWCRLSWSLWWETACAYYK